MDPAGHRRYTDEASQRMYEILCDLRDNHNVLAAKAEFEAEGSRLDEMLMLSEIVNRADMRLIIKIGGCEAVRDLDQSRLLGASGIVGPMIESPFAMRKFRGAAERVYGSEMDKVEWIVNAETKTCYDNLEEILEEGTGFLNTVTIGRVDLAASLGLSRAEIDSPQMAEMTKDMALKARAAGAIVGFGGGIGFDTIPFVQELAPYVDKFETRKMVFEISSDADKLRRAIELATEFELLYLQSKRAFHDRMANEDHARIEMLTKRFEGAKAGIF